MTTEVFSKNIRALSDKYRFIAYDPRSQGRSTVTDTGNNYYQHGRDLHDFLNYLELDYVIFGGVVARRRYGIFLSGTIRL